MSMQIKLFIALRVSYIVPKAHDYQNVPYTGEVQKMVPNRVGSMMIKMFLSSRCQIMVSNYPCWSECSFLPHVVHVDENVLSPHGVHIEQIVLYSFWYPLSGCLSPHGEHVELIVLYPFWYGINYQDVPYPRGVQVDRHVEVVRLLANLLPDLGSLKQHYSIIQYQTA